MQEIQKIDFHPGDEIKKIPIRNIVENPIRQEIEKIMKVKNSILSPDLVEVGYQPVGMLLTNHTQHNTEVNKDYQRCIHKSEYEKWNTTRKIEYLISVIEKTAQTDINIADYLQCKFNNPEYAYYFDGLMKNNFRYGILDGGHRINLLRGIFETDLTNENVEILDTLCSKYNSSRTELLNELRNSTIYYKLNMKLNREQIHIIFTNLNSGVPTSKIDLTNAIISPLNKFFHDFRETNEIKMILSHMSKKDDYKILYNSLYIEYNKEKDGFTNSELNDFIKESKIDTFIQNKFITIFKNISQMIDSYYKNYNSKEKLSSSKIISLYQECSVIFDNKKNIKVNLHDLFVKVFLSCFDKESVNKRGKDNIFRDNSKHFNEKWRFFRRLFNETSKTNFKNVSDDKMSINDFLI